MTSSAKIRIKDARIAELIGERDSLMDQCHGLQRLADERDGLRMRVATLEKHLSGVVNMITDDGQTFTANFNEEFRGRIRDSRKYLKTEKARAALDKPKDSAYIRNRLTHADNCSVLSGGSVITADDQLVAVLAKIDEIERGDGYEGPKIARRLHLIRISCLHDYGPDGDGEEVFEDRLVGAIWRACDARGWRNYSSGPWWVEEDTHRSHISDDEDRIIATAEGESRALAAANAYLEAISHVSLGDEIR